MTNLEIISHQRDIAWSAFLALTLFIAAMLIPEAALATGGAGGQTPLSTAMCRLVEMVNGPTGRALATLAIIIIGVGALMGKVSWGMAIIVAIGIAIVFGAPKLLDLLGAGTGAACASAAGLY